jgi:hypothetical protein
MVGSGGGVDYDNKEVSIDIPLVCYCHPPVSTHAWPHVVSDKMHACKTACFPLLGLCLPVICLCILLLLYSPRHNLCLPLSCSLLPHPRASRQALA